MIEPVQLFWIFFIVSLVFALLVLVELQRSIKRRDQEEMFDTDVFDKKTKELDFSQDEVKILEKLVRASKYENKDAIINSATLFEAAVSRYYELHEVEKLDKKVLENIKKIRVKMNFTASNSLASICSSRQFGKNDRIDLLLNDNSMIMHSQIIQNNEECLIVAFNQTLGSASKQVGKMIKVRWTRPADAVYTANVNVMSGSSGELVITHATTLEKQQLRKWVREIVDFPVFAKFSDGYECNGVLYDLSAGGILLGLPLECQSGQHLNIEFELPSFGKQNVEIEILRSLGKKNAAYPDFYSLTASFTGAFGLIQERVLQYIFEVHKAKKSAENP